MKAMNTKKTVCKNDAQELETLLIEYARRNGMTISNLRECLDNVEGYMRNNATLEKDDSDIPNQRLSQERIEPLAEGRDVYEDNRGNKE